MNTSAEPWGKLDRNHPDPAAAARLSLVAHCIDVAAVMAALLALPTLQARLAAAAGRPLTALDLRRLVVLAFLHDPGKCGAGFYLRGLSSPLQEAWRRRAQPDGDQHGHVAVVAPLLFGDATFEPFQQALGRNDILGWGGTTESQQLPVLDLWLASLSHHGQPLTVGGLRQASRNQRWPTWHVPVEDYAPLAGLTTLGGAARRLFPDAFVPDVPFAKHQPALAHAFGGLVALADWIGSNTDDGFFPYDLGGTQGLGRWQASSARATAALQGMRIDVQAARLDLLARAPTFEQVFGGHAARDSQSRASAHSGSPIVVLEAETGSGKTEAALWRFKTLFEAGAVDALCFLLPTRVAATSIYTRINGFMTALFPDPALRPTTVLAVPGYLRANGDDGQHLTGFRVLWPDVPEPDRPLYWAAENSKRYFAGGAVAGTIDQFLLSTLQVKHAHMRASLALRALVVVDEVHASDAYMTALLQHALERHVQAGGHALLMSATLAGEARARLLTAGLPQKQARKLRPALGDVNAPYPCVATTDGIAACQGSPRTKQVRFDLRGAMRDPAAVAHIAIDAAAQGARVLVLRNTVRQAVATQQAIEAALGTAHPALFEVGGVVAMHHGRYAFADRQLLDARVEALYGKQAARETAARILVGTQTLEISVDCDADLMITDIAPIDVLLQRLGRLHRHAERDDFRSAAVRQPRLVVLTPEARDLSPLLQRRGARGLGLGEQSAYPNLLAVEATWRLLEAFGDGACAIPAENRRLVESGVSRHALERLADELGGPWPEHFGKVVAIDSAQAGQAVPLLVDWHARWGDGGWSELDEQVRTRLGLDGIEVELLRPWRSPFGCLLTALTVPAWMLGKVEGLPRVGGQDEDGAGLVLKVAERDLRYGRWGLSA